MLDLVAQDCLPDVVNVAFVLELGRMHTDDHQFLGILLFQGGQVGNDMHAIDAAIGPEVEQDHLAAQVGETQRLVGV